MRDARDDERNNDRSIKLHQPLLHFPLRPLTHWFADAQNGITDFFAKIGHFDKVCAKNSDGTETCVDGDQLKSLLGASAAGTPLFGGGAPSGSSALGEADADTATSTTPASEEEAADAPEGPSEAPAVSAQEEDVGHGDGAEAVTATTPTSQTSPQSDASSPLSTDAANDNQPADPLPATGTE